MTDPIDIAVGGRIRQLRIERGLTQTELANAIGLTFQQIQKYEKARNRISASKLAHIANIFKVDVAELFKTATDNATETASDDVTELLDYINTMPEDTRRHLKDLMSSIVENQPS